MKQEYLSDIELYYSSEINGKSLVITGDEHKHITKVMRHSVSDALNVTDGKGNYFETTIDEINKNNVVASITNVEKYKNDLKNITFCFPRLKNNNRFEFELEKSVELGITNFIIFHSERTIPKGEKLIRWNKIALAAMKQSLRTFLPKMEYVKTLKNIDKLDGIKIIFDQKSKNDLIRFLNETDKSNEKIFFIFGPEGGLSEKELSSIEESKIIRLTQNRLRAETAVVTAAAIISISK